MEKEIKKEYSNGQMTVVWQPSKCIHSTLCWKGQAGLSEVFNPRKKPWIELGDVDSQTIIDKVDQCPSGALSYFKNNETQDSSSIETETIVEPLVNGPLMVYGNISIKNADGTEERKSKVTAFCRCGASQNKPFCDGSHVKAGFAG